VFVAAKFCRIFLALLDDLSYRKWLPVIGAGMSMNAVCQPERKCRCGAMEKALTDEPQRFCPDQHP